MGDLRGARIAVVGGGIFGFSIALSVARHGANVVLYEAELPGDNASGVAAGMLAPAFESVLDPLSSGHFALLRDGRDQWPAFITQQGLPQETLDRSGAIWVARRGEETELAAHAKGLTAQGASPQSLSANQLLKLQPSLARDLIGGVFAPEDWLIDPRRLLPSLDAALQRAGGEIIRTVVGVGAGDLQVGGTRLAADAIVLAAGAGGLALADLAPELASLTPVKGQILHLNAPPVSGPVVRGRFGYVAPQGRGAVIGATMQPGLSDRRTDPAALAALQAGAAELFPHLTHLPAQALAGVRASTPDGLPLIGRSSRPGLLLALGARRNGWLLGPMVGEMIAAYLLGEDAGPHAAAMDPLRHFKLSAA